MANYFWRDFTQAEMAKVYQMFYGNTHGDHLLTNEVYKYIKDNYGIEIQIYAPPSSISDVYFRHDSNTNNYWLYVYGGSSYKKAFFYATLKKNWETSELLDGAYIKIKAQVYNNSTDTWTFPEDEIQGSEDSQVSIQIDNSRYTYGYGNFVHEINVGISGENSYRWNGYDNHIEWNKFLPYEKTFNQENYLKEIRTRSSGELPQYSMPYYFINSKRFSGEGIYKYYIKPAKPDNNNYVFQNANLLGSGAKKDLDHFGYLTSYNISDSYDNFSYYGYRGGRSYQRSGNYINVYEGSTLIKTLDISNKIAFIIDCNIPTQDGQTKHTTTFTISPNTGDTLAGWNKSTQSTTIFLRYRHNIFITIPQQTFTYHCFLNGEEMNTSDTATLSDYFFDINTSELTRVVEAKPSISTESNKWAYGNKSAKYNRTTYDNFAIAQWIYTTYTFYTSTITAATGTSWDMFADSGWSGSNVYNINGNVQLSNANIIINSTCNNLYFKLSETFYYEGPNSSSYNSRYIQLPFAGGNYNIPYVGYESSWQYTNYVSFDATIGLNSSNSTLANPFLIVVFNPIIN